MLPPTEFLRRPALWLRGLDDTGATTTWSPNFGFAIAAQRVSDDQLEGVSLENVRAFWNAAEKIHRQTMEEFAHVRIKRPGTIEDDVAQFGHGNARAGGSDWRTVGAQADVVDSDINGVGICERTVTYRKLKCQCFGRIRRHDVRRIETRLCHVAVDNRHRRCASGLRPGVG